MATYILRRLLLIIPVIWGAVTLLFVLFFIVPGDPVEVIAGGAEGRAVPENVRRNIEAQYGLDKPLLEQYTAYWGRLVKFDLGQSYDTRRSVNDMLRQTGVNSLRLAIWAIIIEVLIGVSAGILSAVKRYSFIDAVTTVTTAALSAVPVFVLGYLLQNMLGIFPNQHDWPDWARLPVQGIGPNEWNFFFIPSGGQWRYVVLPAIVLACVSTALVARMTRTTMLEVSQADYMRTARAKGLTERQVTLRHGLRNALIPVVTLIGLDLGTMIGSAILTETVFNWPGMGSTIARALGARDAPVVLGLTTTLVVLYVFVNLLVDISYGWLDPRIRYGKEEGK
jgi:ABC-type dipeptide/oligopeptide/nickel transport system permease component